MNIYIYICTHIYIHIYTYICMCVVSNLTHESAPHDQDMRQALVQEPETNHKSLQLDHKSLKLQATRASNQT